MVVLRILYHIATGSGNETNPHLDPINRRDIDIHPHDGYDIRMKKGNEPPQAPQVQHRMLQRGDLLTLDGRLMEAGWATSLLKRYDRAMIRAPKWRIKEWDYYLIASDFAALAVTVADNGYMGLDSVSLMDFEQASHLTQTRMTLMPMGKRALPADSGSGVVRARGKQYELTFRKEGAQRHLYGHVYDFGGPRKPLLFDVILHEAPDDSMVIATPFAGKPHHFYYNQKINCMPADGRCIYDGQEYLFSPATSFGVLDWGRGVWPWRNTWYWASASGVALGARFGFNLGYGFGDTQAATENMLLFDGRAHKLGQVVFDIPIKDGREDWLSPWRIHDDQGRLDLVFEPIVDRNAYTTTLIIETDQHQVFGRFTGRALLDDGRAVDIAILIGFAEKVRNRF